MAQIIVFVILSFVAVSQCMPPPTDNIMACMFCELITDAVEQSPTPTAVVKGMFKRCNRMGLMEPVCDQFISVNAKRILLMAKTGIRSDDICEKMSLCEERRRR